MIEVCTDCWGKGWIELHCAKPDEARVCELCHGTGTTPGGRACAGCHGTGQLEEPGAKKLTCVKCNGTGKYPLPEAM
jgi:DnaJ-class molecular chaperone